jgi:hypothetical protein
MHWGGPGELRGSFGWAMRNNRWHCPGRATPKVSRHGIRALLVRDGRLHTVRPIIDLYQCLAMMRQSFM